MIQVKYMKPFYQKVTGSKLRLVFAYDYFKIVKENEIYNFIPIEGREIIVNLDTKQIENLSDIFVFENNNRFIRLPLYKLLLVSNIHEHLTPLLDDESVQSQERLQSEYTFSPGIEALIAEIEERNKLIVIDQLLDNRDFEGLQKLSGNSNISTVRSEIKCDEISQKKKLSISKMFGERFPFLISQKS